MDDTSVVSKLSDTVLQRLCQCLGIEPGFDDYLGKHHVASEEVLLKLVQTLGYVVTNDATAEELISRFELEGWQEGIPTVAVLHEHWGKAIEIHVPESHVAEKGHWEIRCELGQVLEGPFIANELECLETKIVNGQKILRYRLYFQKEIPLGYHKLYVRFSGSSELANRFCNLIVTPSQCYLPKPLTQDKRLWGFSIQLYSLRSKSNWGIGDFSDLKILMIKAAKLGADFVGLNPLHALFPTNPQRNSPYSPSSRFFLNYLYLDVLDVTDFVESENSGRWLASEEVRNKIKELRRLEVVDYVKVAELKQQALIMAYQYFVANHLNKNTQRLKRYKNFIEQQGQSLLDQAAYDALFAHYNSKNASPLVWQQWPDNMQKPNAAAVAAFVRNHADEVEYYQYLQWLCAEQLDEVQQAAKAAGMRIGLYRDLAVSVDAGGAESWSEQGNYSFKASVGAPPDPLAVQGQDWGLPPLNPHALRKHAYSTFIKLVRANMEHAGALRIDHVMWLFRLWWIPQGYESKQAAYIYYPFDDLLGILALESQRSRCMVIGEDLGTVPEQIRNKLPKSAVYSYKVMYFEKSSDSEYKNPAQYEPQALATISTHDLATLAGWWQGTDLKLRDNLDLFPDEEIRQRVYDSRQQDRQALLESLIKAGLWERKDSTKDLNFEISNLFSKAAHTMLAQSQSALMAVQIEDLLLMEQQVNLPGTTDEYQNWCRKLTIDMEDWMRSEPVTDILASIHLARSD